MGPHDARAVAMYTVAALALMLAYVGLAVLGSVASALWVGYLAYAPLIASGPTMLAANWRASADEVAPGKPTQDAPGIS